MFSSDCILFPGWADLAAPFLCDDFTGGLGGKRGMPRSLGFVEPILWGLAAVSRISDF